MTPRLRPAIPLFLSLVLGLALATPALALEGMVLGGKSARRGPTAAEQAETVRTQREALQKRAEEMAIQEKELREQAALDAKAAAIACPPLVQIKYPWVQCVTNEWGGKDLVVPGTGDAHGMKAKVDFPKL